MNKLLLTFFLLAFSVFAENKPKEIQITADGEKVTVSIFQLDEPLIIKPLYEPRDDLDSCPWLKPLLFSLNGYALTIPKEEWSKYGEGKWSQERYDGIERSLFRMKQTCIEHPDTWGNSAMYNELSNLALCKVGKVTYLVFNLVGKKMDGTVFGSQQTHLKRINGIWVNPYEPKVGRKRSKQLYQCYKNAMALVEKGELAIISESELKNK